MSTHTHDKKASDLWLLGAVVLSGAVALGYEMMWTRLLSLVVGGELLGILGVLAGFFGGMAIGAFAFSNKVVNSRSPIRMFLLLEAIIIIYGLMSPHLIHFLSSYIPAWLGPSSGDSSSALTLMIIIIASGLILLPATIGMGANFAYLVEARRRFFPNQSTAKGLARIYAANTLGAVFGIFLSIYWIMPALGFSGGAIALSTLGILAILSAYRWYQKQKSIKDVNNDSAIKNVLPNVSTTAQRAAVQSSRNPYLVLLFATGFLAIGLEIVVVHHFKQILENTIFSFGNILAIYLLGSAAGAWLFQRFYNHNVQKTAALLVGSLATTVLYTGVMLSYAGDLLHWFSPDSTDYLGHLRAELLLATVVFLIPTICMGALFSLLVSQMRPEQIGTAYGVNTIGAVFAPFLFGLLFIPMIGGQWALMVCWAGYMFILVWGLSRLKWASRPILLGVLNILLLSVIFIRGIDLLKTEPGYTLVEKTEGLMGVVAVSDKGTTEGPYQLPARILQVNNQFKMGGGASFLERRMGNVPLLMTSQYDNALFLGVGTGSTMGVIADYPFQEVEAVEIVPEVKRMLPYFKEHNLSVLEDNRLSFHLADARRFVNSTEKEYDVILVDLFHPARDGAGLLFSKEHFELLHKRLSDDGLLAFWLPTHQFDAEGLKMVVRTFLSVFPESHAVLGSYNMNTPVIALLASKKALSVDLKSAKRRIKDHLKINLAVENIEDLTASYFMNSKQLARYAGDGPLNTDLNPRLLFHAPKSIYIPNAEKAAINMKELRKYRTQFPSDVFNFPDEASAQSAQKSWAAAGIYLAGNEALYAGNQQKALQEYIRSYTSDPSFSPARGQLFQYALKSPELYAYINQALMPLDRDRLQYIKSHTRPQ